MSSVAAFAKPVRLLMDVPDVFDRPEEGDVVVTQLRRGGEGTNYLVLTSRRVQRRDPAAGPRYAIRCRRIHERDRPRGARVIGMVWWPRKRRGVR